MQQPGGSSLAFFKCVKKYECKPVPHNRLGIDAYLAQRGTEFDEDVFYSYELSRCRRRVRVPGYRVAIGFAFETNPALALCITKTCSP